MSAMLDIHNRRWWQLGNLMAARPMTRDLLTIGELPPAPGALLGVMINDLTHLALRQQLSPHAWVTGLTARLTLLRVLSSQLLGFLPRLRSTLLTRLRSISRRWRGAITRSWSRLLLDRAQPLLQPHQELHARLTPRVIDRLSLRPLHTNQVRRPTDRTLLWKAQRTERLLFPAILQAFSACLPRGHGCRRAILSGTANPPRPWTQRPGIRGVLTSSEGHWQQVAAALERAPARAGSTTPP